MVDDVEVLTCCYAALIDGTKRAAVPAIWPKSKSSRATFWRF